MRKQMTSFTLALWFFLLAAWVLSGDRLLNWAYEMPDLGPVDDAVLALLDGAETLRSGAGLHDYFGEFRTLLHSWTGFGRS